MSKSIDGGKKMSRYLYWGPFPQEQDGGAVVNYYNIKAQNLIRPRDEYFGLPKVKEELDPTWLPFVNYPLGLQYENIPDIMSQLEIPILNIFHLGPYDFERIIDPVHDVGGKIVLHQTIHWSDDVVLKSGRLADIDCIVAPTNYAKRIFVQGKGLPPDKIPVIPHGVDTNRFYRRETILRRRFGIRKDQAVILYSGRLGFWKGVHQIIPIVRPLVKEYDCVFIIRGGWFWGQTEGEKLGKIFAKMSKNNPNLIFLPDWQPPEVMEEMYAMTDILLFPSAHEGFGVPLIEAQSSMAVPVTTALANHREILGRSGDTGIMISPRVRVGEVNDGTELFVPHSDELYGATKWLLDNPEERKIMGMAGRQNVLSRFDLNTVAQGWLDLYDQLCPPEYSMEKEVLNRLENL